MPTVVYSTPGKVFVDDVYASNKLILLERLVAKENNITSVGVR